MKRLGLTASAALFVILLALWIWNRLFTEPQLDLNYASFTNYEPDPFASARPPWSAPSEIKDQLGRVTLTSFWSPDCVLCFDELTQLGRLGEKYKHWDLNVIAIELPLRGAPDETEAEVQGRIESIRTRVLKIQGLQFAELKADPSERIDLLKSTFSSVAVPATALIDSEGRIAMRSTGANDWMSPESLRMIEDIIVESRPDLQTAPREPNDDFVESD